MSETRIIPVPDGLGGERLDTALSRLLGLSRNVCAGMLDDGDVTVDGRLAARSERVQSGSLLEVVLPSSKKTPEPTLELDVLYEDDDLIIINKPVGVAAHTGPGWDGPTVIGSLEAGGVRVSTSGPPERKGIVQRLDVGTSGVMMVAKSERAYSGLKHMFRERTVGKTYHAVVEGHPDPPRGTVDAPIGRHPSRTWRMAVIEGGKPAITHYDTIELLPGAALLEIGLETGRTHQIRVHMSAVGHPCVGDTFYGADPTRAEKLGLTRQWLHARVLEFKHPITEENIRVEAPYPEDLTDALEMLRNPVV
ncbi:MAG: RluA family pseudouridine synthase [Scrofimicrobium sp.]